MQADVLDRRPDNGQATVLGREDIDLIGALAHIALRDFQLRWWSECADALRPLRCLCEPPTLARGGRKQVRDSSQQTLVSVSHDEVELSCST